MQHNTQYSNRSLGNCILRSAHQNFYTLDFTLQAERESKRLIEYYRWTKTDERTDRQRECFIHRLMHYPSNHRIVALITRPERPCGAKDEVKQARRTKSRPVGPPARSRTRRDHRLLVT